MLLFFKNVWFAYNPSKPILKDISFAIKKGEKVALLGLNGSGKSTLILHTNGLLIPQKGEVYVKGITTNSKNISKIRQMVGLVFQNPDDQLFMPTVEDDVAFGPRNMKLTEDEVKIRVVEAMKLTKTENLIHRSSYELSGGQKKSVSIATVLSMNPELLVMDEPTSGMDYQATQNFIEIVESLNQTFLISTHDIDLVKKLCNRAIILKDGQIEEDCPISILQYPRLNG